MTRKGTVTRPVGVKVLQHELDTAVRLTALGHDVEFVRPQATQGRRTHDVLVDGQSWELKSPMTANQQTIVTMLRRGRRQANTMVLDLNRSPLNGQREVVRAMIERARQRYAGIDQVLVLDRFGSFYWPEER